MKILFVTSEAYPLVKTGGLGDVAGALPAALRGLGADARVMLPAYPDAMARAHLTGGTVHLGDLMGAGEVRLLEGHFPDSGVPLWLVDCPPLFDRAGDPYMERPGQDWWDNWRRFGLLSKAAAIVGVASDLMDWQPDVIHAHDWQTGLVPAFLRAWTAQKPPVMFTIHNMQYAGGFGQEVLAPLGLPQWMYQMSGLEFYGLVSYLKAGLSYARTITTVSPTYAREIQTPEGGRGMDGLLRQRSADLIGILNGIDMDAWNPLGDPLIAAPIDPADPGPGKAANKAALMHQMGLEGDGSRPLFGLVSRFVEQKGIDMVLHALPRLLEGGAQLAVLGSGEVWLEHALNEAAGRHAGTVAVHVGYNERLAHLIEAGSDFLLVPSRFEPCGLTQLYALRYGTLPVVRRTGGLADSVVHVDHGADGTGVVFDHPWGDAVSWAVGRAIGLYHDGAAFHAARRRAMAQDFSWNRSAATYLDAYAAMLA